MKEIEAEGKTVTIAVEKGLKELGLRRDQVEVQVIEESHAGFLGLGAKPARVRIREKIWDPEQAHKDEPPMAAPPPRASAARGPAPARERHGPPPSRPPRQERQETRPPRRAEEPGRFPKTLGGDTPSPEGSVAFPRDGARSRAPHPSASRGRPPRPAEAEIPVDTAKACSMAAIVLKEIMELTGFGYENVRCQWDPAQSRVQAELDCDEAELLIGKGGHTIESLQFLVTIITGRRMQAPVAVQVETQGYWKDRERKIIEETDRAAAEVKRTGRSYRFDPMEPALRRLIHRHLAASPDVETSSEGEGPWRKVVLSPKRR